MKTARLDQILIRFGYVTEDQIRFALERQLSSGGRLGSHLLHFGFVTEDQLARALSAQHEVACFVSGQHEIDASLVSRLPIESARELQIFPFKFDSRGEILYLTLADPSDKRTIAALKRGYGASRIEIYVAPESVLDDLVTTHHRAPDVDVANDMSTDMIDLSDLHEPEAELLGTPGENVVEEPDPIPYHRMMRSLVSAIDVIAVSRRARASWTPSYRSLCNSARHLCMRFGLERTISDGLQLALRLLVPGEGRALFADFGLSVDTVISIRFPWRVDHAMHRMSALYDGAAVPQEPNPEDDADVAAQILAIVWYRFVVLERQKSDGEDINIVAAVQEKAGILASHEVVEAFIATIEADSLEEDGSYQQVLIVSRDEDTSAALTANLQRRGCRTVWTNALDDAQILCGRHSPAAVIVDHDSFPHEVERFSRMIKLIPESLLYAVTASTDAASITSLHNAGVDGVFAAPFDFDAIAGSVWESIREAQSSNNDERVVTATFEAFAFVDLVQALSQSRKSVRVDLRHDRETATIYVREGLIIHAASPSDAGKSVIYQIIGWGEKTSFSLTTVAEFPGANISESNESILMEGCRLLDESHVN